MRLVTLSIIAALIALSAHIALPAHAEPDLVSSSIETHSFKFGSEELTMKSGREVFKGDDGKCLQIDYTIGKIHTIALDGQTFELPDTTTVNTPIQCPKSNPKAV